MREPYKSKRQQRWQRPDAQRGIQKFKLDLVKLNLGTVYLTQKRAVEGVAKALFEARPDADREKVCELVATWWLCEG